MKRILKILAVTVCLALTLSCVALANDPPSDMVYGTNLTELPIIKEGDKPITIDVWAGFNSTVMTSMSEMLVWQQLQERTGIKINFINPPVGQETENYNMTIASDNLPHFYYLPPAYPGGVDKAVDDGIYLPLKSAEGDTTPNFYDDGLTPNYKWIRDTYPDLARDTIEDSGRIIRWRMFDMIGTEPWSGIWVRQDILDQLGLALPVTIADWDKMLRAMKGAGVTIPLAINIRNWYGVATNYAFSGTYGTGYNFINKDGTVAFGPSEPGYEEFLTLLAAWYADGLIDPDFATRDNTTYFANIPTAGIGAFTASYGEIGQVVMTGVASDPNFKIVPVRMPLKEAGQVTQLRQYNATTRSDSDFITTRALDDGIAETVMRWKDYWYSQDGGDLCSYGVKGLSYDWVDGKLTWMYMDTGLIPEGLSDTRDFWTLLPFFKMHVGGYLRNSASYDNVQEVWDCIAEWGKDGHAWVMPDNMSPTPDEQRELANVMQDVNTYRDEMTAKFIIGQEPLSNIAGFQSTLKGMGIDDAVAIQQAALERYLAR